jgi:TetR/AcrR family transcriptional repressor of bet genes
LTASEVGPRPGRPPTGARERILAAGYETLLAEGYAGLTMAKVAVRAGDGKALISYHFGSKQGLVAAVARQLGDAITTEVLAGLGDPRSIAGVVRGVIDGIWRVLDRDERIARAYFDLNAVSIVSDDVRAILREVKSGWRAVLADLLVDAGVSPARVAPGTVLITAGVEGLALERIERGETPELERARRLFARTAAAALA